MKKILLVVDMQKGFARYDQTIMLTEKIRNLLERELFDVVIATRFLNDDNSIYEKLFGWKRLKTKKDRELADGYEKYVDYVYDKSVYTCVNSSFIQRLCQLNDGVYPEEVFIVGADTDCCVLTIATGLFECNIRPIVLTKYCDSNGGPSSHAAGLLCMKRLIGGKQLVDREILQKEDLNV
jgi:nicotinamidase-related amidase